MWSSVKSLILYIYIYISITSLINVNNASKSLIKKDQMSRRTFPKKKTSNRCSTPEDFDQEWVSRLVITEEMEDGHVLAMRTDNYMDKYSVSQNGDTILARHYFWVIICHVIHILEDELYIYIEETLKGHVLTHKWILAMHTWESPWKIHKRTCRQRSTC